MAYADTIWRAGGRAELHVWPGAFHGFDGLAPEAALSRDARDARTRWLRRILAQSENRETQVLGDVGHTRPCHRRSGHLVSGM
ncbi:alpha/beta hydrolase [Streptomyces sp. NPDC091682]|uniref:alpha/beta hydrolase n=1 Tax=unclassified Streptomyces TaxID=2593676 RepID=UPI00380DC922